MRASFAYRRGASDKAPFVSRFLLRRYAWHPRLPQIFSRQCPSKGIAGYKSVATPIGASSLRCLQEHNEQFMDVHLSSKTALVSDCPAIVLDDLNRWPMSFSKDVTGEPAITEPAQEPVRSAASPIAQTISNRAVSVGKASRA